MSQPTLAISIQGDNARIKVSGRATFECTEDLKAFCLKVLEDGTKKLTFEMAPCISMDSTFMGMMAKIALEAKKKKSGVSINNIGKENRKNLFSLGLGPIFEFTESTVESPQWDNVEKSETSQSGQRQNIIDAHQTLIDVNEDNRSEFQDIVDFLNMEKELEENEENDDKKD